MSSQDESDYSSSISNDSFLSSESPSYVDQNGDHVSPLGIVRTVVTDVNVSSLANVFGKTTLKSTNLPQ